MAHSTRPALASSPEAIYQSLKRFVAAAEQRLEIKQQIYAKFSQKNQVAETYGEEYDQKNY